MTKEYQVFHLDPDTKMSHIEGEPLLETNDLAEACGYIYDAFQMEGLELCIYQPRHESYRGWYRHSNRHTKRGSNGQFVKA